MNKACIKKIEVYFPTNIEVNENNRLTKKIGIYRRHKANNEETTCDMAYKVCKKLFNNGIDENTIDFVLLCTQSPDYFLPTTACILQDRLGLRKNIGALDFNLGCSGYIYGLSLAKGLIETNQAKNVLLVTAEAYTKYINDEDNTVKPLFGDAASATLISISENEIEAIRGMVFGTDGSGYDNLIVPRGAMKYRYANTKEQTYIDEYGNKRTDSNLYMNGSAISDFALDVVPKTVLKVLEKSSLEKHEIDYYIFHQANKFMLNFLRQKCELMEYPFWNDVENYGNTVSSSIPIAIVDMLKKNKREDLKNVMLVGFGVGLSWSACIIDLTSYDQEYKIQDGGE